jgi:hypothetical protein
MSRAEGPESQLFCAELSTATQRPTLGGNPIRTLRLIQSFCASSTSASYVCRIHRGVHAGPSGEKHRYSYKLELWQGQLSSVIKLQATVAKTFFYCNSGEHIGITSSVCSSDCGRGA